MWPQPYHIHLLLPLVPDPGLDQVLAEDVAGEQELMIEFERP
jgi:hypothetical protein